MFCGLPGILLPLIKLNSEFLLIHIFNFHAYEAKCNYKIKRMAKMEKV